jgi:DeoR/GlpR family transcriptional regulator of sugar metabolism
VSNLDGKYKVTLTDYDGDQQQFSGQQVEIENRVLVILLDSERFRQRATVKYFPLEGVREFTVTQNF